MYRYYIIIISLLYHYYIIIISLLYIAYSLIVVVWILFQVQKILVRQHSEVQEMEKQRPVQAMVCLATFSIFQYKKWSYYSQSSHS